jgi:adenine-specific DNA-methyltransferase
MATNAETKLLLTSPDVNSARLDRLREIFPEAFTEGKIDFEKFQQVLSGDVTEAAERYGLSWTGKSEAIKNIQTLTTGTLLPARDESVNFDSTGNLIIEGDNLEVLKLLQGGYHGRVKMIYIDPPYNTGGDFIYPDNYKEGLADYLKFSGQISSEGVKLTTNPETDGRYHSKWLTMMFPRLFLARNLLREDGVIFVSIDDHEVHNLCAVMNEIFGEENFVGQLAVVNNLKGRNDRKNIATCHEHLVIYAKSQIAELKGLPLTDEQRAEYKYIDEHGEKYTLRDLRKRGRPDRREDRPKMWFPIFYNQRTKKCSLERISNEDIEITPKRGDGSDGRWRWGKERVGANIAILEPRYSSKNDRWDIEHRVFLKEATAILLEGEDDMDEDEEISERSSKSKSFWMGGELSTDVGRRTLKEILPEIEYDYPKAVDFIKRCLYLGLTSDDLVLDFFAGSGTTAQAVLELNAQDGGNRKFILIQLPEPTERKDFPTIADITKERVRRVTKKLETEITAKNAEIAKKSEGQLPLGELEGRACHSVRAAAGTSGDGAQGTDASYQAKPDLGFKVFKLSSSNFKVWDAASAPKDATGLAEQLKLMSQNVVENRGDEALLYELLLKSNLPLTGKIQSGKIGAQTFYDVADGTLAICLERKLTLETLRGIIARKPRSVICLDIAFAGNDQLKTNIVLEMKSHGIEFHTA